MILKIQELITPKPLTINTLPSAPNATDETVCEGGLIPDLTALGANIQWHDDAALTNVVFSGSPFARSMSIL